MLGDVGGQARINDLLIVPYILGVLLLYSRTYICTGSFTMKSYSAHREPHFNVDAL